MAFLKSTNSADIDKKASLSRYARARADPRKNKDAASRRLCTLFSYLIPANVWNRTQRPITRLVVGFHHRNVEELILQLHNRSARPRWLYPAAVGVSVLPQ